MMDTDKHTTPPFNFTVPAELMAARVSKQGRL
jgi:hypothetical protein